MIKKISTSLSMVMLTVCAYAGGNTNFEWAKMFGVQSKGAVTCIDHAIENTNSCIGTSVETKCATEKERVRADFLAYGILMLTAVDIKDSGARFCPVTVESMQNQGNDGWGGNTWTTYSSQTVAANSSACVWLCAPGFSGPNCEMAADTSNTCDTTELRRDNYSKYAVCKDCANIEHQIDMIQRGTYSRCGDNSKSSEFDTIIAVQDWLPNGHGAWVRPMVVQARHRGDPNCDDLLGDPCTGGDEKMFRTFPHVFPLSGSEAALWCKNGYKSNGSDCVPIDQVTCATTSICPDWVGFNREIHTMISKDGKDCLEFRCAEPGFAFPSSGVRTVCEECVGLRRGPDNNGVCQNCAYNEIYNKTTGRCETAYMLSNTDLHYGFKQTRNTVKKLEDQCWVKQSVQEFRDCVLQGI